MIPITELKELQEIELNIMKSIHEFCEANDIKYVLAYGTLIGAVRHDGFIPWDDDIDIHMPRNDYDRFVKMFPEWGKERNIEIVSSHTVGNEFPRDILKVCDNRTLLVAKNYKNNCKMGVFVDIWPLDKMPNDINVIDKLWIESVYFVKKLVLASDIRIASNAFNNLSFKKKVFMLIQKNLYCYKKNWRAERMK